MRLPTKTKPIALPVVVIGKQENVQGLAEKINVVLTPAYYWFKSESLPVHNVAQAKKLAPSLFDGSIPDGEYSYYAIKQPQGFWLFAYNDAQIAAKLTQLGVKSAQIANIYFVQTECEGMEEPLLLHDGSVLMNIGGVASVVPQRYSDATLTCNEYFAAHPLSRHTVSVSLFRNSFLDEKYLYRVMALTVALIIAYFGHYLMVRQELREILGKEFAVIEQYHLPQTSFELDGLKNALANKEQQQMRFREQFKALLGLPLQKGEYLQKLQMGQKSATLEIALASPERAEALKAALQKHVTVSSAKVIDKIFYVAVGL